MDNESGAQFATKSHQTTIDLQAGIIASQKNEIDRLNVLAVENAAEIASIKQTVKWYQGEAGKRMGAVARADIAAPTSIRRAAEEVLKWRKGTLPVCGWLLDNDSSRKALEDLADAVAAPAAPSEQAGPTGYKLVPIKPTPEMIHAMRYSTKSAPPFGVKRDPEKHELHHFGTGLAEAAYCRALAAAPAAPLPAQPERSDAQRYQRLRILGAAPFGSPQLEGGTVLCFQGLDAFLDADIAAYPSRGEFKDDPAGAAPLPELAGPSEAQILAARAEGRAEALQIVIGLDAEDALGKYTWYSRSGAPEDEGSAHWEVEKLRELFGTDDKLLNLFDRAEGMYWEASGKSDDADRMMIMVRQAPYFKPLHDFLSQHEAWGLMADLQRANESTPAASPSPAPAPTEPQQTLPLCNSALRAEPAGQQDAGDEWLPIETAPKGASGYSFMQLAWGPEGDQSTGDGIRWGDRFFASAVFHCLGVDRRFELREIEVTPTHWMPSPAAPAEPSSSPVPRTCGDTKPSDAESSPASRMGGITSKESAETAERTCYEDDDGATRCISCHANHDQNQEHGEDCWVDRAEKVAALAASSPLPKEGGAVYGIIDPDYGRIYTMVRKLAWEEGYAIGLHGSFTRDLDLIAAPWDGRRNCNPEKLVARILQATGLKEASPGCKGHPGEKPHGRLVWTLLLPEFGDPRFVDLSIMPAETAAPGASTEDKQ